MLTDKDKDSKTENFKTKQTQKIFLKNKKHCPYQKCAEKVVQI